MNHHAQLVRTNNPGTYSPPQSSVEVLTFAWDKVGIDDVRTLVAKAQLRPVTDHGQLIVVATSFVTHEAQNALLKLFEEPPADTSFLLVVPPAFQLLPTLQSRIGQETTVVDDATNQTWDLFLAATYADRLQQIDSWQKTKDPQWLTEIVSGLHSVDRTSFSFEQLQTSQLVGQKLQTRGASNKMLLEHLALALPFRK